MQQTNYMSSRLVLIIDNQFPHNRLAMEETEETVCGSRRSPKFPHMCWLDT